MAIAHVCVQCGWDLARVRPQREAHYGLNLVRCPRCAAASVRRTHPLWGGWRRFRRLDFALTMIVVRLSGVLALTFFSVIGCIFTIAMVSDYLIYGTQRKDETGLFLVTFYLILPTVLGAFLTAAFAHIRRWKLWLGWLAWMSLVLFVFSLHGPIDRQFDPRDFDYKYSGQLPRFIVEGMWYIMLPGVLATIAMMIAAVPGVFIGRLLLRLRDALIRAKWRWRYRRLRLAGSANI